MSLAWYRKWRPAQFSDVIGQDHVIRILRAALKNGSVSHAYLFNGPRGVGKTTTARILARSVNCADVMSKGDKIDPCGTCQSCIAFDQNSMVDCLEIDAASNRGIDDIRALRETIHYSPVLGRRKVYIIDEVHMLTKEAFNALLKTLEEPPKHVLLILATTEIGKVPDTILSRCQRFDFRSLSHTTLAPHLEKIAHEEGIQLTPEGAQFLAEISTGSGRDALSLLQQVSMPGELLTLESIADTLGFVPPTVTRDLLHLMRIDLVKAISMTAELLGNGADAEQLIKNILRELTYAFQSHASVWATDLSTEQLLYAAEEWGWALRHIKHQSEAQLIIGSAMSACAAHWHNSQEEKPVTKKTELLAVPTHEKTAQAPVVEQKTDTSTTDVSTIEVKIWKPDEDTNALWNNLKNSIKKHNHSLASLLNDSQLLGIENTTPPIITIGVHFPFHKKLLQSIKNRQLLQDSLKVLTGVDYRIECSLITSPHAERQLVTEAKNVLQSSNSADEELSRMAEEMFTVGGK